MVDHYPLFEFPGFTLHAEKLVNCTGLYQKPWATNNTLTFCCQFSLYKTETQLIFAGLLDDYPAECLMSLLLNQSSLF